MSTETWPPPSTPADTWVVRPTYVGRRVEPVRLRLARLWDKTVAIDEAGRAWCVGCCRLVEVAELGSADNGHTAGLPMRSNLRLRPMADDGDDRRAGGAWTEGF